MHQLCWRRYKFLPLKNFILWIWLVSKLGTSKTSDIFLQHLTVAHLTTESQNILNLETDFKELELCKWQVMNVMGLWRTENLLCCATVLFIKDEITLWQCYNAFFIIITSTRNCTDTHVRFIEPWNLFESFHFIKSWSFSKDKQQCSQIFIFFFPSEG